MRVPVNSFEFYVPLRRNHCREHVFYVAVLHSAKCAGYASGPIQLHGLCKSGLPLATRHRYSDDLFIAHDLPIGIKVTYASVK